MSVEYKPNENKTDGRKTECKTELKKKTTLTVETIHRKKRASKK